jgi:hypothetical protein
MQNGYRANPADTLHPPTPYHLSLLLRLVYGGHLLRSLQLRPVHKSHSNIHAPATPLLCSLVFPRLSSAVRSASSCLLFLLF